MSRILIVDDHHLVRAGLRNILASNKDLEIVGEAENGEDAIRLTRDLSPDIVLMDISLPGMSGFEATERILKNAPGVRVIVLTAHSQPPFPARLLDIGAAGYLTKACKAQELLGAIAAVGRGERYIGSEIAQQLAISLLPGARQSPFQELTSREMEVMLMMTQGITINGIAEVLNLSPKTVATYKYRIFDKANVNSEVELLREAMRHGLINSELQVP